MEHQRRRVQIAVRLRPPRNHNDTICVTRHRNPSSTTSPDRRRSPIRDHLHHNQHSKVKGGDYEQRDDEELVILTDKAGILSQRGGSTRIEFPVDVAFGGGGGGDGDDNNHNNASSTSHAITHSLFGNCLTTDAVTSGRPETVCVFAYGNTGSGKTHTMLGSRTAQSSYHYDPTNQNKPALTTAATTKTSSSSAAVTGARRRVSYCEGSDKDENDVGSSASSTTTTATDSTDFYDNTRQKQRQQRQKQKHLGIVQETVQSLFSTGAVQSIMVSIVEVYCEQVFDLLDNGKLKRVRERPYSSLSSSSSAAGTATDHHHATTMERVYVDGMSKVAIHSLGEWQSLVEPVLDRRRTAATTQNDRSSRSHAVVFLKVADVVMATASASGHHHQHHQQHPQPLHHHSRLEFCFVDLAGSERPSSLSSYGPALTKESIAINKSLTTLGTTIQVLVEAAASQQQQANKNSNKSNKSKNLSGGEVTTTMTTTPASTTQLRDSVLTWLLQRFLTGASWTTFIACVDSGQSHLVESVQTLRFVGRLRGLHTMYHPPPPSPSSAAGSSEKAKQQQQHQQESQLVKTLRAELEQYRQVATGIQEMQRTKIEQLQRRLSGLATGGENTSSADDESNERDDDDDDDDAEKDENARRRRSASSGTTSLDLAKVADFDLRGAKFAPSSSQQNHNNINNNVFTTTRTNDKRRFPRVRAVAKTVSTSSYFTTSDDGNDDFFNNRSSESDNYYFSPQPRRVVEVVSSTDEQEEVEQEQQRRRYEGKNGSKRRSNSSTHNNNNNNNNNNNKAVFSPSLATSRQRSMADRDPSEYKVALWAEARIRDALQQEDEVGKKNNNKTFLPLLSPLSSIKVMTDAFF